ncbi:hypothetical protein AAG570_009025 [Ranatra chinensis]|uniref:Trafficking protein particle complex subunit 12 n=1 Tax=Ranatra chinensis TaxID=642074 RepID=A0ABD0YUR1_9HEMI
MVDNVTQLVKHHFGEGEASHRKILTADDVSQDERGICDLIRADCLRAALNLTRRLLTPYGQKVTPHSVQLWFTRLSLLVKLSAYQIAEAEGAAWWHPDRPDLYYQFYPKLYGARPGTMLPFQMRLLLATLPAYIKRYPKALDRLYSILAVVRRILKNLDSGKKRELSKRVWTSRDARVSHSIVNVALMAKDYPLAVETLRGLIESNDSPNQKRALESALGRVLLQVGDVHSAERCFEASRALRGGGRPDVRELVDRGLALVANNNFRDAYDAFKKASTLDPYNIMVFNNMAVCLLYLGQLKNALTLLTTFIHNEPARTLTEPLLINVCTLFELESSRSDQNKQSLLRQVAKYKGDAINVACLKLLV